VHLLLRTLIETIPSSPATLLPLLERNFPPQRDRKEAQVVYYTNILKIVEYVPHLTEGILELVVAKAIKIDVGRL
jgi:RNA polymerase I-specific transcription initiation factor RRN3